MQSDMAKSDGLRSDLGIRWAESSDFDGPSRQILADHLAHRVLKSKNGIGL